MEPGELAITRSNLPPGSCMARAGAWVLSRIKPVKLLFSESPEQFIKSQAHSPWTQGLVTGISFLLSPLAFLI